MTDHTTHTPAGSGPHHLMLGSITVSRLLASEQTAGQLALVELQGGPGTGPGPHVDPWRESFYVLEGQITFRFEQNGVVHVASARPGDAVSIPAGIGHAFSVTSPDPARFLILGSPAGIDRFFADAGEPIDAAVLPSEPSASFDRDKLLAAFAKHDLVTSYSFPAEQVNVVPSPTS